MNLHNKFHGLHVDKGRDEDMVLDSLPTSHALPAKAGRRKMREKTAKISTDGKVDADSHRSTSMSGFSKHQPRSVCPTQESKMGVAESGMPPTSPMAFVDPGVHAATTLETVLSEKKTRSSTDVTVEADPHRSIPFIRLSRTPPTNI